MSEENVTDYVETQIRVESVDGGSIKDAEALRLQVVGQPLIIMALSEIALAFLQSVGGEIVSAVDTDGNPVDFGGTKLDVLATGDDSVA